MQQGRGARQYSNQRGGSNDRGGRGDRGSSSPNYRGGGRDYNQPKKLAESYRNNAQQVFRCGANDLYTFKETDPFNRQNIVDGIVSKVDGSLCMTHVNNTMLPRPLILWGMSSMGQVLERHTRNNERSLEELLDGLLAPLPSTSSDTSESIPSEVQPNLFFLFSNKWNGANIQIFKYFDANGSLFVSARHRGSPFVRNYSRYTRWDSYFTLTQEALLFHSAITNPPSPSSLIPDSPDKVTEGKEGKEEVETTPSEVREEGEGAESYELTPYPSSPSASEATPQALSDWKSMLLKPTAPIPVSKIDIDSPFLSALKNSAVQSIIFELVGSKCPHLVHYEFPIDLKPLVVMTHHREVIPYGVLPGEGGEADVKKVTTKEELIDLCSSSVEADLEINQKWRKERGLPVEGRYWYNYFKTEGKVVYLLQQRNGAGPQFQLFDSSSFFKVKPRDIAKRHWEDFDNNALICVLEGLDKLYSKGERLTEQTLAREMDLNEFSWAKYAEDIMKFAQGVPRKQAIPVPISPSELHCSSSSSPTGRSRVTSRVLITVGYPGCGKSTFANKLIRNGPGWSRVNQDELGTRGAVERAFEIAVKTGKNVIVDRTNFDIPQRHYWISTGYRFGVRRFDCVEFRISSDLCKKRVTERENHPTIPKGDSGIAIVEKFVWMTQWPLPIEGFDNIWTVTSDEEADALVDIINPPSSTPSPSPAPSSTPFVEASEVSPSSEEPPPSHQSPLIKKDGCPGERHENESESESKSTELEGVKETLPSPVEGE